MPAGSIDRLPAVGGAYGLLIRLPARLDRQIGALGRVILPPGRYLYLGSAYGPGGLASRLGRHIRADKRPHWHVDRLTAAGRVERIFALPGGCECDLADRALALTGIHAPVAGFGSSDCRRCKSHMLSVPTNQAALIKAFAALC